MEDFVALQRRQRTLMLEMQHRVRNILAVVRGISRRTSETSSSIETYAAHLDGRINALARTQTVLARAPAEGMDLETMIADELLAHAAREDQAVLSGPQVALTGQTAETLGLAFHELAANAVKCGALSKEFGRLQVSWSVEADDNLRLVWRESGVAVASIAPRREGFGRELLQRTLPYALGAKVDLHFAPGGLVCTMSGPLARQAGESFEL
ncbi:sensor histidine kinase [Caulobacter sp. 73W]|uniref:histidine kinase n=1 Tax=Caulobacter sp. 73W TaxID=3161137 RepID=A0AB39KWS2_9CAUL